MQIKVEMEFTAEGVRTIVLVDGEEVSCRDMRSTEDGFMGDRPGGLDDDLEHLDDEDLVTALEDLTSAGTDVCRELQKY